MRPPRPARRAAVRPRASARSWAAAALVALAFAAPGRAQSDGGGADGGLVFQGVPASEALAAVAARADVDVVFSTALVGDRPVWCGGAGWSADDLLRCVTEAVGLDYVRRSTGTVVVVARVVEPAARGAVAGLVVDRETGRPLRLAHVRLGPSTAVTDADGRFALAGVPAGPHVLLASYVGYRPQAARLTVRPGAVARAAVRLRPAVSEAGTVVVSGLGSRAASEALGADAGFEVLAGRGGRLDGPAPLGGTPASTSSADGPALRPLLGVGGRSYRDALSIQGGEAGDHALTVDGARVYEPLRIGPALGSLAPLAVGRVTVRKAGFGARHGSHLAGLVEAEHALDRPARPLAVAAEADAYAAAARLGGRGGLGTWGGEPVEAVGLVAARRGLWDLAPPSALGRALRDWNGVDPVLAAALGDGAPPRPHYDAHRHGSDVSFADVHAAGRLRAGPLRSARASVYAGSAGVATDLFAVGAPRPGAVVTDPAAAFLARDATRWTNLAASVRADALVSARWRVGAGARLSRHAVRQRYDALDGAAAGLDGTEPAADAEAQLGAALDALHGGDDGNELATLALDADAAVALGWGHEFAFGAEATAVRGRFHLLSAGVGATAFRDLDAAHGRARVAAFAEGRHRLGPRWTAEPGLRLTAWAGGDVVAEPRLALRYDALPADRLGPVSLSGLAARLAAGVYRQFETRVELATFGPSALVPALALWLPLDGSVPPPTALHVAGEVLWQPSARWEARVEGYAKALPRVYALDYGALLAPGPPLAAQADFLLAERGRAAGLGARVERRAPRWAASAGLSVARTDRRSPGRFGGRWVPAPWAEPVRATLGLDVLAVRGRGGSGLTLRARALGVWGRSWALRRAYYDVVGVSAAAVGAFALDRPDADRLPPLVALDVGASWTLELGPGRRVELALDVENVLDRRNALDWSLRPEGDGVRAVTRALPGAQPSLRLRVTM